MNNISPRETTSIWNSDQDRFLTPLFTSCDAKITGEDFKSILAELVKPDSDLQNLNEIIKKTYLEKDNVETVFRLFLENCKSYPAKQKKEPSLLKKLNKTVLLMLHLEHVVKKEEGVLVQLVMDHFDTFLEILLGSDNQSKVVEGGCERKILGLYRVEILRLIHHCLMINHKNFNLMVSMSKFGDILPQLVTHFHCNDRFLSSLFDVMELILSTNHKPLIESVLGNNKIGGMIQLITNNPHSNHFLTLKLLRLVDIDFCNKCVGVLERELSKDERLPKHDNYKSNSPDSVSKTFLQELQKNDIFNIVQVKAYGQLKKDIRTYFDLEKELEDRNNLRMTGSSIFSNNLMDDNEMENANQMPESMNSEERDELDNMANNDDNDDIRNSYDGIVRRRKISEDNIKVGSGRGRGAFGNDFM